MDGDFAPISKLVELRKKHGFLLAIDDVSLTYKGSFQSLHFSIHISIVIYIGVLLGSCNTCLWRERRRCSRSTWVWKWCWYMHRHLEQSCRLPGGFHCLQVITIFVLSSASTRNKILKTLNHQAVQYGGQMTFAYNQISCTLHENLLALSMSVATSICDVCSGFITCYVI